MKGLKWVAIGLAAVVALFVAVGFILPSTYEVERSIVVDAPAALVFDHVNDRAKHIQYSPWDDDDATMKINLGDVTVGEGATYSWTGEKSGEGKVTITKSEPHSRIEEQLEFGGEGPANAWWTFEEAEGGTRVTWGFGGDMENDLVGRYFAQAMDSMVGPYFERGLAELKTGAEAAQADSASDPSGEPDPPEDAAADGGESEAAEG